MKVIVVWTIVARAAAESIPCAVTDTDMSAILDGKLSKTRTRSTKENPKKVQRFSSSK